MWKQFDQMVKLPTCSCQASKEFNDFNQLIKLFQFLMEIDSCYQQVRSNLLCQDPLHTLKLPFPLYLEKNLIKFQMFSQKEKLRIMFLYLDSIKIQKIRKKFNKGPNPNLKCTHCNKISHTMERCFELVGYPPDFKQRLNHGNKANSSVNKPESSSSSTTTSLTADQVTKLLSLLSEKTTQCAQASNVGGNSVGTLVVNSVYIPVYDFSGD
jgi:hypothetical protein